MLTYLLLACLIRLIHCESDHPSIRGQSYWSSKLVSDLFDKSDYDKRIRPSLHYNSSINITIRINLYLISQVDERSQTIQLYVWFVQMWYDELLAWNPKHYGGLESVVVPHELVWLPDTYLYNGIEMVRENSERWTSVIISMNRSSVLSLDEESITDKAFVTFRYPAIYKFTCRMNILRFPFDKHRCRMTFGSWTYDSSLIKYRSLTEMVLLEDYIQHSEWHLVSFQTSQEMQYFQCCTHPFSLVHADLVIRRKPLFTIVNLIIPTTIINFIAMFGFFSPTTVYGDRTEKVSLGITTLLAMSILLLMVSEEMPTTSDFIPLIGWFYLSVIIFIAVGTILSSVVIIIQRQGRERRPLPKLWKQIVLRKLAPKLLVDVPKGLLENDDEEGNATEASYDVPLARMEDNGYLDDTCDVQYGGQAVVRLSTIDRRSFSASEPLTCQCLRDIRMKVNILAEYLRQVEQERRVLLEWKCFALTVDRFLLIIFNLLSLMLTVSILGIGFYSGYE